MPPSRSTRAADEAIRLAASAGLILDDWQQWVLRGALGVDVEERWVASTAVLVMPRQNGKNAVLEALELAAVFLWDVRTVLHSAHKFDTSQEHYLRMRTLIEGAPHLMDLMPHSRNRGFTQANGKEAITLANGNRIKFLARAGGSGRGYSPDLVVFDEAYDLDSSAMGNMIPALSARTMNDDTSGVQMWFTSSAPHHDSDVLQRLVGQGRAGAPGMFYAEWGNEPGTDLDDRDAWAEANPGLGIRISEDWIVSQERLVMPDAEFARERVGIAELPDTGQSPISDEAWRSCQDDRSVPVDPVVFGVEVGEDRRYTSIVVAATSSTGGVHVEIVEARPGTDWVAARCVELCQKWSGSRVAIVKGSPAWSLELDLSGVPLAPVTSGEFAQACGSLADAVAARSVKHRGDQGFVAALRGARSKASGDAWVWSRKNSATDISSIVAATVARWVCMSGAEPDLSMNVW